MYQNLRICVSGTGETDGERRNFHDRGDLCALGGRARSRRDSVGSTLDSLGLELCLVLGCRLIDLHFIVAVVGDDGLLL